VTAEPSPVRDSVGADTTRTPAGPALQSPSSEKPGRARSRTGAPGAGPVGHPQIGRPRVDVIVDPLVPSLWRALCRECPYSEGPSVKTYVAYLAAPFHGHAVGAA